MIALLLALGCAPPPPMPPVFVRGGVISSVSDGQLPADGQLLPDGRWLADLDWTPGKVAKVGEEFVHAPLIAECVPLFHVDLGDVSRRVASVEGSPDAALAFSPDGTRLALGTHHGDLLVVDAWSGDVLAQRHLSESLVKQVAWSADGQTLYAAEQSPDAYVHALDASLATRWSVRLADRVETSAPPPSDDVYGVYTLPAAYGLQVLPDGSLLVAAVHAWNPTEGERRNLSQLLVIRDGNVVAAWPQQPASITLMHPRAGGGRVIVPVGRSATGPAPDLPVGGVQILSLPDLVPVAAHTYPPLSPWYSDVFVWEAVDVSADAALVGLADGRVFRHGATYVERDLGTPIVAGGVPIGATIGHAVLHGDDAIVLTSGSAIPWGAADPALRPPAAHPEENGLSVLGPDLATRWTWHGPQQLTGLTVAGDTLIVGAGPRATDDRRDLFGALVFDIDPGASDTVFVGERQRNDLRSRDRLRAFCATEAPVFFRQAATSDGRVAVIEIPWTDASGVVHGEYRATVLR